MQSSSVYPRNNLNPEQITQAIAEIQNRPDLSDEAKQRGIRSLMQARARLLKQRGKK